MKQFRRWAFWRRVQYIAGTIFSLGFVVALVVLVFFPANVSCFDAFMNGDESGVDCGGSCVRICTLEVIPPSIQWAKSFEITPGQYNAVAYVENKNQLAATAELRYTFQLFNNGVVVTERSGVTVLPPNSVYPIFEGRIFTGDKVVTDTRLILETADIWQPATIGREQFRASNISLLQADFRPRLEVAIENTELTGAEQVEVVATLFNDAGEPLTASQTYIETINPRSTQNIVFTWPQSIAKTVRSCIIPTDVVLAIDLSGSMNNDGGTPPEPVTAALAAASNFAANLSSKDRAGVVTFATSALTPVELTTTHSSTAATINTFTIATADETGFTNTSAALIAAETELNSSRHNVDARRVLILLTDGLPTAPDGTGDAVAEAIAAAESITASGINLFAIGLGEGVDREFIASLASTPEQAFLAPSRTDLTSIYETITSSLCESGTARIDVIAKTKTNFTPLR
jgi:Mg-chelatase subunit ChlD